MAVTFTDDCFDPLAPIDPVLGCVPEEVLLARLTGHHAHGWEADPKFRVTADDVERAADALLVVADRFMNIGESGVEHDGSWRAAAIGDMTPGITRVSIDDEAAYVAADTSGELTHEMAETMKLVLVQELTRAGVSAVVSADYNPIRGLQAREWTRPAT